MEDCLGAPESQPDGTGRASRHSRPSSRSTAIDAKSKPTRRGLSRPQVEVRPTRLESRLVFLPAFHINYSVGTTKNDCDEKVPDEYEAMVGATPSGRVVSERHISGPKAAALATGASSLGFAALGAAAGTGASVGGATGVDLMIGAAESVDAVGGALGGVAMPEFAVFTVVFGALARLMAQRRTRSRRVEMEEKRIRWGGEEGGEV